MIDRVSRFTDAETVALMTLSWILQDEARGERLLALTGLTPDLLRAGLMERSVQAAVLEFLANNESDLLAAADALQCDPARITEARTILAGRNYE